MPRDPRYRAFGFVVEIAGNGRIAPVTFGAFSECSGLGDDATTADHRSLPPRGRKGPGLHQAMNVTLKRGLVNAGVLDAWMNAASNGVGDRRAVTITRYDDAGAPVSAWRLTGALPIKYTGPTINAKGTDVAMEELTLSLESLAAE